MSTLHKLECDKIYNISIPLNELGLYNFSHEIHVNNIMHIVVMTTREIAFLEYVRGLWPLVMIA